VKIRAAFRDPECGKRENFPLVLITMSFYIAASWELSLLLDVRQSDRT
jgi:hypothetical protein